MICGIERVPLGFLICEKHIDDENIYDDLNNLLVTRDISYYTDKDLEEINNACKYECYKLNLKPT